MMSRRFLVRAVCALCLAVPSFALSQNVPNLPPLPPIPPLDPVLAPNAAPQIQPGIAGNPPNGNLPNGIEVLARGPVHEAFASPSVDPRPTQAVPKKPPQPLEEMAPEERPEGDVVWIPGYWAWDDDRQDFLWVSGCWRTKPPGKTWVPGFWRDQAGQSQYVPGFWTNAANDAQTTDVAYYPEPPPPPQLAPPGDPPNVDMLYVPGYWMWTGNRYVWRAGYWTRGRAGLVYVASHYRWTPRGYVFVPGYWDYAMAQRGVLYAPIVVDQATLGPRFVYTPYYAVRDTVVVECFFVRPGFCHYYFGDYYGPRYATLGFECGYVYGRRHYDPIVAYRRWEYREQPHWIDAQINLTSARSAGRAPLPPRTLVQQTNVTINNVVVNNVVVNNGPTGAKNGPNVADVLAPTRAVVAARGARTVALDAAAQAQAKTEAVQARQSLLAERVRQEQGGSAPLVKPFTAPFRVPGAPAGQAPSGASPVVGAPKTLPSGLQGAPTAGHDPMAKEAPGKEFGPRYLRPVPPGMTVTPPSVHPKTNPKTKPKDGDHPR